MAYTFLITDGEFKSLTSWSYQLDTNWINANFRAAQDKYVETLLTTDLYNELVAQVSANTVTALNQVLWDKVKPALAWRIAQDGITGQIVRVANLGVVTNSGQNEQPNLKVPSALRGEYQTNAEHYEARVRKYLNDNKDDYPLYQSTDVCCAGNDAYGGDTGIGYPTGLLAYVRRGV